ncbi:hypothetical protein FNV43_RR19358 [Rhamnella rubrinervis]|uniref:Secreted protein n=1 Tax=Rhamnella rubrinervis TaxID=2594499 RepID=A0A8K0GTT0_9ROSA|nr:hypothetical protein FNV43_RR19358 [Rhamnella rubrinervis]
MGRNCKKVACLLFAPTSYLWSAPIAMFNVLVADEPRPRPEERDCHQCRPSKIGLALDEVGHVLDGFHFGAIAGESRGKRKETRRRGKFG